jgi:hypothetical protein
MGLAVMLAALLVERRKTRQGRDLLAADLAKLGHANDNAQRCPRTNARHTLNQVKPRRQIVILPQRRLQTLQFFVASFAQTLDVALGDAPQPPVTNMLKTGFDADNIFLKLFNKSQMVSQRIETRIRRQLMAVPQNMRTGGDQHGVNLVGLGAFEMQLGEGLHLHRLHDNDGEPGFLQIPCHAPLIAAGRLDSHQRHAGALEVRRRTLPTRLIIGDTKCRGPAVNGEIERRF